MRIDYVTLVQLTHTPVNGFPATQESTLPGARAECWAEKKDATRSEYYAAMSAGMRVDAVFEVSPIDYAGQQRLIHGAEVYDVKRAYQTSNDAVELTCSRVTT